MRVTVAVLATAAVAVLAAPGHAAKPVTCKKRTINATLDANGKNKGEDISRIICKDVTGDGRRDALFTVFSGGTAGDIAFGVLRGRGAELVLYRKGYKIGVERTSNTSFDLRQPIYRKNDPNCCPSAVDTTPYRWNGKTFKPGQSTREELSPPA